MSEEVKRKQILVVARDADAYFGLPRLLEQQGYEVHRRDNRIRSFQFLTVYTVDLVIVGAALDDASGADFCRELRRESGFGHLPLVVIGPDDPQGTACLAAFAAGADDFIQVPYVPEICLARCARLIKPEAKSSAKTSLSVRVGGGELPGILQYLESEQKTGKLEIKSGHLSAVVWLQNGRLVNAEAMNCKAEDAIIEVISWANVGVLFHDMPVPENLANLDLQVTSVVMNAVVEVDEFRERQRLLPPANAMLLPGPTALPENASPLQRRLYELATTGCSRDELLREQNASERLTTLLVHELIENQQLLVGSPPFENYEEQCRSQYRGNYLEIRFNEIRKALAGIQFPIAEPSGFVPFASTDWLSPAPRLVLTGDHPEYIQLFLESIEKLYISVKGKKPPQQKHVRGAIRVRLDFDEKRVLDLQLLPPILDKIILANLNDYLTEVRAMILVASSQDRETNKQNMRLIRLLRQRFRGVFFHVVPRVVDSEEGVCLFKINCEHCGYKLAVGMDDIGVVGECPICGNDVAVPDCLDHLADVLQLPPEVPVVQIEPKSPLHCRDLLIVIIDNILACMRPPTSSSQPAAALRAPSEVRSREPEAAAEAHPAAEPARQVATTQITLPAEQARTRKMLLTRRLTPSEESQPELAAQQEPPPPEPEAELAPESAPAAPPGGEQSGNLDLEEILEARNDDFEIDSFIDKVK